MEAIDQQVINENKDIYAKIQTELVKAKFEILIASAWFTDEDLFNILLHKLTQGVHIEVIVADNEENERLDFALLTSKGASVYKIKSNGYGGMNQKFCVIDKRIALHGSYNWTMNAKKNNQESIISTNHQETIHSLINNFDTVKNRILEQRLIIPHVVERPEKTRSVVGIPVETVSDFEQVLDSMIAAEIGNFDRKFLSDQGFQRCKSNNGDHQVLYKALDTVYSVFINNIDVIDDKKKRLVAKVDEHRIRTLSLLNNNSNLQIDHLEQNQALNKKNLETRHINLTAEIEIHGAVIASIQSEKIASLERQTDELDRQIKSAEQEFLTPIFKWFEVIPTSVFGLALLVYLFVFYSSAAYILLFSINDAKEVQLSGAVNSIVAPQIFNPTALGKALQKGGTAPLFIFLFVFVPLSVAVMDLFVQIKWIQITCFLLGVVVLDSAVAYKVTEVIHDVNYLSGNTTELWHPSLAFTDTNFYLVFIFGALGLVLFKFIFKKFIKTFEDRNPDILTQRNRLMIKHLLTEIEGYSERIRVHKEELCNCNKQIIQLKAECQHVESEIAALPLELSHELKNKKEQLAAETHTIEKKAAIYIVHIQSDNLPISVDALKDRINIFLEGWNDYLFQEFAVARATAKTTQAFEMAMTWQNEKLQTSKVDKRIKFNSND